MHCAHTHTHVFYTRILIEIEIVLFSYLSLQVSKVNAILQIILQQMFSVTWPSSSWGSNYSHHRKIPLHAHCHVSACDIHMHVNKVRAALLYPAREGGNTN